MKINNARLRRIIAEETRKVLKEQQDMPRFTGQNRKKNINLRYFLNETMETQENNLLKEESPELERARANQKRGEDFNRTVAFSKKLTPQIHNNLNSKIRKYFLSKMKNIQASSQLKKERKAALIEEIRATHKIITQSLNFIAAKKVNEKIVEWLVLILDLEPSVDELFKQAGW